MRPQYSPHPLLRHELQSVPCGNRLGLLLPSLGLCAPSPQQPETTLRRSQGPQVHPARGADPAQRRARARRQGLDHPPPSRDPRALRNRSLRQEPRQTRQAQLRGEVLEKGALGGKADRKIVTVFFSDNPARSENGPPDLPARRPRRNPSRLPRPELLRHPHRRQRPRRPSGRAVGARRQRAGAGEIARRHRSAMAGGKILAAGYGLAVPSITARSSRISSAA